MSSAYCQVSTVKMVTIITRSVLVVFVHLPHDSLTDASPWQLEVKWVLLDRLRGLEPCHTKSH
jgi:hypothetical protein